MSDSAVAEVKVPDDRPPAWANSLMSWALTKPILQTTIGKDVALLTFEGRRTGNSYTIPISYHRVGDVVTVVTKKLRKWWHNFEDPTEVHLRLAGETYSGKAEIVPDFHDKLDFMTEYLAHRPIDAKAYGLGNDELTRETVTKIIPQIVIIRIEVAAT